VFLVGLPSATEQPVSVDQEAEWVTDCVNVGLKRKSCTCSESNCYRPGGTDLRLFTLWNGMWGYCPGNTICFETLGNVTCFTCYFRAVSLGAEHV